jgi:ComEC/Rec2-related protein
LFPGLFLWSRYPAFISWCAISLGIVVSSRYTLYYQAANTPHSLFYNSIIVTATISLFTAILVKKPAIRFCCFFFSGLVLYQLYSSNKEILYKNLKKGIDKELFIYGKVSSPPLPYPKDIRYLLSIDSTSPDAEFLRNKIVLCLGKTPITQGATARITGKIKIPGRKTNPYEFDDFSYLLSNGIATRFMVDSLSVENESISLLNRFSNRFRSGVASVINKFTDPDHRAIFYAAFLGETQYLSPNLKTSFRNSGIYHLLSISGLHAAMLIGASYFMLSFLPIPLLYRHCIALVVIWLYQCFIGFIPCLFRATLMASLVIITFLFQKKSYPVQAIGLAGTIWLLLSPDSLFQPGYQLSFAATFGILTIYPVFNRFQPAVANPFVNYFLSSIVSSLYLSFTGLLCTLPIVLYYFGSISIFGLIANLIAVPVMTLAMWCFFIAIVSTAIFPLLVPVAVFFSKLMFNILLGTANFSLVIPWSRIMAHAMSPGMLIVLSTTLICIATIAKKYQQITLVLILPVILCSAVTDVLVKRFNGPVVVTKFNTEQASMIAINWANDEIWLIIRSSKKQLSDKYLKIAQNWILHQGNSSVKVIFLFGESKNREPTVPGWEDLFTKVTVPEDDTLNFILNARSLLKKYSDTCRIFNRNDTPWVKITRVETEIQFPVTGNNCVISLQNHADNSVKDIISPCVVTLKKHGYRIHIYKFPGK